MTVCSIGRMVNYLWGVHCTLYRVLCKLYNLHKILDKYSTHEQPKIFLNTSDRSSGVVFLTASCFLGQKAPELVTTWGYLDFYKGILYSLGWLHGCARDRGRNILLSRLISSCITVAFRNLNLSRQPCCHIAAGCKMKFVACPALLIGSKTCCYSGRGRVD